MRIRRVTRAQKFTDPVVLIKSLAYVSGLNPHKSSRSICWKRSRSLYWKMQKKCKTDSNTHKMSLYLVNTELCVPLLPGTIMNIDNFQTISHLYNSFEIDSFDNSQCCFLVVSRFNNKDIAL